MKEFNGALDFVRNGITVEVIFLFRWPRIPGPAIASMGASQFTSPLCGGEPEASLNHKTVRI